jgi:hypothetical protein
VGRKLPRLRRRRASCLGERRWHELSSDAIAAIGRCTWHSVCAKKLGMVIHRGTHARKCSLPLEGTSGPPSPLQLLGKIRATQSVNQIRGLVLIFGVRRPGSGKAAVTRPFRASTLMLSQPIASATQWVNVDLSLHQKSQDAKYYWRFSHWVQLNGQKPFPIDQLLARTRIVPLMALAKTTASFLNGSFPRCAATVH